MVLVEFLIYLGIITIYLLLTFTIGMFVQGLTYWLTGFSIYNYLTKKLF